MHMPGRIVFIRVCLFQTVHSHLICNYPTDHDSVDYKLLFLQIFLMDYQYEYLAGRIVFIWERLIQINSMQSFVVIRRITILSILNYLSWSHK